MVCGFHYNLEKGRQIVFMFIVYIDVFSELDFNDLQFRISKNGVFAACIHLQGVTGVNIVNNAVVTARPVPEITVPDFVPES